MKRILSVVLMLVMAFAFAFPAMAAEQVVYLKGTGTDFTETWKNVFYMGGHTEQTVGEDPTVWHIVCSGDTSLVTEMQLDFGANGIWKWLPRMGFSTNQGGNNPGWVVVAPHGWQIVYVNSGNNNESNSFMKTTQTGRINFNISGYHEGSPSEQFGALNVSASVVEQYVNEYHKPKYQKIKIDDTLSSVSDTIMGKHRWFRYVEIDARPGSPACGPGVRVEIAKSAKKDTVKGIGYHYNVQIVDNKLYVSFDGELIRADIVARAFTSPPKFKNNGGHVTVRTGGSATVRDGWTNGPFTLPDGATKIYLYVHFGYLHYYATDAEGNRIVIGCAFDRREGPFTRPYEGEVTMIVENSVGVTAYEGPLGLVEDLAPGVYSVKIYGGGRLLAETDATVALGQTAIANFGELTMPGEPIVVIVCDYCAA